VEDIAISPRGFDDEIQMQAIEIQGPGLGFLLSGEKAIQTGRDAREDAICNEGCATGCGW